MSGNLLEKVRTSPITQSIGAVKNLLAYIGRASDPLPADVSMDNGRLVLILSNKRDAYYTCTSAACSCPSATYRHNGPCKHQRKYFPVAKVEQSTEAGSIRPDMRGFRPVDSLPSEERAASSSFCMVDTTPDATPREIAYHSIREDKIMWPVEA